MKIDRIIKSVPVKKIDNFFTYILYSVMICGFIFFITLIHYAALEMIALSDMRFEMFIIPMGLGITFSIFLAHNSIEIRRLRQLPFENVADLKQDKFDEIRKIFNIEINPFHFLPYFLGSLGIVMPLATFHMLFILKIPFRDFHVLTFVVPLVVSSVFGFLLGILTLLRRGLEKQNLYLINNEKELQSLNNNLEDLVEQRTRKIIELQNLAGDILNSQESIVVLTDGCNLIRVNNKFFELFHRYNTLEEFKAEHKCISEFFKESADKNYISEIINDDVWVSHIAKNSGMNFQALIEFDGKKRIFDVTAKKLSSDDKNYYVSTFTDITSIISYKDQLEDYSSKLKKQLYTDTLTALPNRLRLRNDLADNPEASLIIINIDSFQEINNFFGHDTGDDILIEVSERIKGEFSLEKDVQVYRIAGDIYAVLYRRYISAENLRIAADRVSEAISEKNFWTATNFEFSITVTMGIVLSDVKKMSADDPLALADIAVKTAKELRKKYLFYSPEIKKKESYGKNIYQAKIFKQALSDNKLFPYYQPILNNITLKTEKYECLARISDPEGNIVLPENFIYAAKTTKMYPLMTRVMIDLACREFQSNEFEFSMNINIQDILDSDTVEYIFAVLEKYGMADRVVFEILESEGIYNFDDVVNFIERAKSLGCRVAIDDFGSGFSNFEYILRLDVDYLKIDQSLIKHIDVDKNAQVIVKNILNFTKDLGIQTIAEHIHSQSVFDKAKELGVDYSQGYYIGVPAPFFV